MHATFISDIFLMYYLDNEAIKNKGPGFEAHIVLKLQWELNTLSETQIINKTQHIFFFKVITINLFYVLRKKWKDTYM